MTPLFATPLSPYDWDIRTQRSPFLLVSDQWSLFCENLVGFLGVTGLEFFKKFASYSSSFGLE